MGKKSGSDAAEADLAPAGWMPANKAEIHMLPRYRRFTRSKRVQMALDVWQAREDEDLSLSQLARDFGVTRVALNRNWKQRLEAAGETYVPKYIGPNSEGLPPTARNPEYDAHKARLKSSAAMAKVGGKSLQIGNERRRVGDFWEFEKNYFGHIGCPDCDDEDGNPKRHSPPEFQRDMIAKSLDPDTRRLLVNMPPYHRLALETPILTANRGWLTMEDVLPGDYVFSMAGTPTEVLGVSEIVKAPTWKVSFSDGSSLLADAEHRWWVDPIGAGMAPRFMTTKQLAGKNLRTGRAFRWRVPVAAPLEYPEADLPVEPYSFGAWLGDGTTSNPSLFTSADPEIPDEYLTASVDQRLALLQGLMDTDGTVKRSTGECKFTQLPGQLLNDVQKLLRTFGISSKIHVRDRPDGGLIGVIRFFTDLPVFRLERKADILRRANASKQCRQIHHKRITRIEQVESRFGKCIRVAHPSETFLAGEHLTVTGNSKTTTLSVRRTLYQIVRDPNYRLLLVSQTAQFAEQIMSAIMEHFVNPDLYIGASRNLIDDWGPFKDPNRSWSASQIYVAGRTSAEKDPTIQCLGIGSQIYGRRADEIVFDDVVDTSRSKNPDQVQADLSWTDKMALSRIGKKGRAIWVGTRVAPGDLYSHLERRPSYEVVKYPAILDEAEGTVLWPDHFPLQQVLTQKDEMSAVDFQLVYQQLELPGAGAAFDEEMIDQCKDSERQWGHFEPGWHLVAGLDPAGANAWSGYTSLVLMGVDPVSEKRFLIDAVNVKQMKAPQIFEQMLKWSEEYPLAEWRVESNGLQSQLVQYNDDLNRKLVSRGTRVVPHFTHGNKWDPVFGVESMAPLFRHGMVSIPWASTQARAKFQPLVEQLLQFPMGSVSDLVMAMWFADLGLREKIQRQHLPLFNSRQKVPKRVARRRRVVDFNTGLVRGLTTEEQRPGSLSQTASQVRRVTLGAPYDAANPPVPEPDEGPNFVNV